MWILNTKLTSRFGGINRTVVVNKPDVSVIELLLTDIIETGLGFSVHDIQYTVHNNGK